MNLVSEDGAAEPDDVLFNSAFVLPNLLRAVLSPIQGFVKL